MESFTSLLIYMLLWLILAQVTKKKWLEITAISMAGFNALLIIIGTGFNLVAKFII